MYTTFKISSNMSEKVYVSPSVEIVKCQSEGVPPASVEVPGFSAGGYV